MTAIRLQPFTPDHFDLLIPWFPTLRDLIQWGGPVLHFPLDAAQLQKMLDLSGKSPPQRLCWMAESGGGWVGHVQLALDWMNGVAVVSRVAIAPEHRGKGYARPMVRELLAYAFSLEAVERVELYVYPWNAPAIRTYERLGFVHEGTRRSSAKVGNERWDTSIMALLRPEWEQQRP